MNGRTPSSEPAARARQAAQKQARSKLLWDMARFGLLPALAFWGLWWLLGGGFPWPLIPTLIVGGWALAIYVRFRALMREVKARTPSQVYREDAVELPRVRFDESGDLTDSFVRQLYNQDKQDEADN